MSERPGFPPVDGLAKRTGSIPPPPPRPARAVPSPVAKAPTAQPVRTAPAAAKKARTAAPADTTERAETAPVTLSLPTALAEATTTFAKKNSVSYPDLVMDAIVASHEELPALIAQANNKAESDGLFVRTHRSAAGPRSTRSFRMRRDNLEVIDQLAEKVEAESRSQLCRVALERFLESSSN
ncbi:hypothetical protein [Rhodococcus sp. UFZ-B548]|uniref:hypothetical protein n=1 Tax=Rhodococcus sp. UFZ-B548 TaxID=2742212 RepID=UPI0015F5915B|nr:hypothetical protein [Rhodococcus sp. UFZ-B548]